MKKLMIACVCFLFSANIFSQKIDTIINERWNDNIWQISGRSFYTYNSDCRLTSNTVQDWDTTSKSWANNSRFSYKYLNGDYVSQFLFQIWDINLSVWTNFVRISYTFDASFKVTKSVEELWIANTWQNSRRTTNTYDVNGYLVKSLIEQWIGAKWQNFNLDIHTNNSNGNSTEVLSETWKIATSTWDTSSRNTYTYSQENKMLTDLLQLWQNNKWINNFLTIDTYDSNDYLIKQLAQTWNINDNNWVNQYQRIYTNNNAGSSKIIILQTWNDTESAWQNDTRSTYIYVTGCTLPLTLIDFTATKDKNATVNLNWQTANEVNTSHFILQRSLNAINFSNIVTINAKENSTANNYSFTDDITKIKAGTLYYRLQMFDKDGKFTTSKIISITIVNNKIEFSIQPNPATSYFLIKSNTLLNNANAVITITDFSGKVVVKQTMNLSDPQKVNISALSKGEYLINIKTDDNLVKQKLIVQ
jgi:type IX secretion system substrate protein